MKEHEALFYRQLENDRVKCDLCPQDCYIADGNLGICRARKNVGGKLYSLNYGRITAYNMDPIEKKPLYHFYPGKQIFSIGSFGCNLTCSFCQNWQIAHKTAEGIRITAQNLVNIAENQQNNIGIAYTYNEPSIWYEFVYEIASLLHEKGLKNVMVTNGYIAHRPLEQLLPYIDAMNIDLKAFNKDFYRKLCRGDLEPVIQTIERASKNCHVEITTLVIQGINDSREEIGKMAQWIASLHPDIPLHLSRYFPAYKMSKPSTPVERLYEVQEEARKYLNYVYIGNVPEADRHTYCPQCKNEIVKRTFQVEIVGLEDGKCGRCGHPIHLVYCVRH